MEFRYFGQCKQCGKEVGSYYKSQLPTFCSYECSNRWKWEHIRKRKKFNEQICANCGKKFFVYEKDYRIKESQSEFYCCTKCWAEAYRERKRKTCPICNKTHNRKSQTCCKECGIKLSTWKSHEKIIGQTFPDYEAYKSYAKQITEERKQKSRSHRKIVPAEERKAKKKEYNRKRRGSEKYKEYMREYLKKYNEQNREKRNKRHKERLEEDEAYRFKVKVRKFICQSFKRRKESKMMHTEEVLGCSFEDFMAHIISQFREGMTIENYGEWQIDHIIPLCTAKNKEDVIRLCHYSNLQPLWAKENREKGSKIVTE